MTCVNSGLLMTMPSATIDGTIDTKGTRHEYDNKEGIILETHRTEIQWQSDRSHRFYQVRIDAELDAGLAHVQYFSESELDWTMPDSLLSIIA